MHHPKAVVLLSGGLDSATVLAIARSQGFEVHALSFRYGQRHVAELLAAERVAVSQGVSQHKVCEVDASIFGTSALTTLNAPIPQANTAVGVGAGGIPSTYVPARNTLFLSYGLAYAESIGSIDIFIGVSDVDYSGYPDCRPEFIQAYEQMANLATRAAAEGECVSIHAPLIGLSKAATIIRGIELGVDYRLTTSCYDPDSRGAACGRCDACLLRLRGFSEAGLSDPAPYQLR